MKRNHILKLHWKLFFPLVGVIWLIIGITITYFVRHETQRQKDNLENRLINVNNTVIDAYNRGLDLQNTVNFIKLFTGQTTLDPLHLTVYDQNGKLIADNPATTISLNDYDGKPIPELNNVLESDQSATVHDVKIGDSYFMVNSKWSSDGFAHSLAALPYKGEVVDFLKIDPAIWIIVVALGLLSSAIAYFGVRAICRNIYALRDFAQAISSDTIPDNLYSWHFSKDELGDVSRNLLSLYRDKIHAEHEKMHHERQIGMNISHELNTPIGIIKGYLDTVLSDEKMPDAIKHKFLVLAQQNTNRLISLVNDVGTVMRLQENATNIECTAFDFHNIAIQLSEDINNGNIADNMTFEYNVPVHCMVMGHESLLTNAMFNLVYNAIQHSGGTQITLHWIRKESGQHIFTFSDNGRGVAVEHLDRLFDMFYRVDSGRSRKLGGSGLGLALVHRIIVAMGGEITASNVETGGLRFTFSIPAAD